MNKLIRIVSVSLVLFNVFAFGEEPAKAPVVAIKEKPTVTAAIRGVKAVNDDMRFLLDLPVDESGKPLDPRDDYSPDDTFDLFLDFLSGPWTRAVDPKRPVAVQMHPAGSKSRNLLILPISPKVLLNRKKGLVVEKPGPNVEEVSGLDGFLANLLKFDLKIRDLEENLFRFSKAGNGYLRYDAPGYRALIGAEEGDVKIQSPTDKALEEILGLHDLIAVRYDGSVLTPEEKKKSFDELRKETLKDLKIVEDESEGSFKKRITLTERSLDVAEEFYLGSASARFGFRVDKEKKQALFGGNFTAVEGTPLDKAVRQIGDIPSAFSRIPLQGAVIGSRTTLPLTEIEQKYVTAQADYTVSSTNDILEKNRILFVKEVQVEEKKADDAEKTDKTEKADKTPKLLIQGKTIKQKIEARLNLTDAEKAFIRGQLELTDTIARQTADMGIIDMVARTSSHPGKTLTSVIGFRVRDPRAVEITLKKIQEGTFGAASVGKTGITEWTVPENFVKDYVEIFAGNPKMLLAQSQVDKDQDVLWVASGADASVVLAKAIADSTEAAVQKSPPVVIEGNMRPLIEGMHRNLTKWMQYEYPPGDDKGVPQKKKFLARTETEALKWAQRYLELLDAKKIPEPHFSASAKRVDRTIHFEGSMNGQALTAFGRVVGYYFNDSLSN